MATTVPSRSRPLYTRPKLPAPTRLASAKFLVACASSSSENCLAPWNSGADEVRPNRPHSADQQAITRKLPRRDEICRRSTCMNCRVTYPAWEEPRTSRCRSSGHAAPCAAAGRTTPRPGRPPAATRRRRQQCRLPPGLAMPSGRPGHRTCKERRPTHDRAVLRERIGEPTSSTGRRAAKNIKSSIISRSRMNPTNLGTSRDFYSFGIHQ